MWLKNQIVNTHAVCYCPSQASVSPSSYTLSKCFLPEESTVIGVYCSAGACLLLLILAHCLWMKGLLQCLSLCLLGKHKSLWTALPRVHHVLGQSHDVSEYLMWGFADATPNGPKNLFIKPQFVCPNVLRHCDGPEYIFYVFKGLKVYHAWYWC